jgi:hypothetical protein
MGGGGDGEGKEKAREKIEIREACFNQAQKIEGYYCKFDEYLFRLYQIFCLTYSCP